MLFSLVLMPAYRDKENVVHPGPTTSPVSTSSLVPAGVAAMRPTMT
jgi:hypothetical protein